MLTLKKQGRSTVSAGRPLACLWVAVGLALSAIGPASATELLVNGGFETEDLTGWVPLNNFSFSFVQCPGPDSTVDEGNCSFRSGPIGSDGTLAQGFNTDVGSPYRISFAFLSDGSSPADFSAVFDGIPLVSFVDPPASGFQSFSFVETATLASSTLEFNFRNDTGFYYLDAVSAVSASVVPEPASISLLGVGLISLWAGRRRRR